MTDSDKLSSLVQYGKNYIYKKFYSTPIKGQGPLKITDGPNKIDYAGKACQGQTLTLAYQTHS